jgi:hypothetical protein
MAVVDFVKWNGNPSILAWKFPSEDLSTWTQLIVNETQEAYVVKEGVYQGPFGAGRHTLSTENIPLLRELMKLPFGGNSPFTAEVWFVNKAIPLDLKWGTLSEAIPQEIAPHYARFGLEAQLFRIMSISMPQNDPGVLELKKSKAAAARWKIEGTNYQQARTFDVMQSAAGTQGMGGAFASMGLGQAAGQMVGQVAAQQVPGLMGVPREDRAPTPAARRRRPLARGRRARALARGNRPRATLRAEGQHRRARGVPRAAGADRPGGAVALRADAHRRRAQLVWIGRMRESLDVGTTPERAATAVWAAVGAWTDALSGRWGALADAGADLGDALDAGGTVTLRSATALREAMAAMIRSSESR